MKIQAGTQSQVEVNTDRPDRAPLSPALPWCRWKSKQDIPTPQEFMDKLPYMSWTWLVQWKTRKPHGVFVGPVMTA